MKQFILCIITMLTLCVNNSIAQDYTVKGTTYVQNKKERTVGYTATQYTWEDSNGKKYVIYVSNSTGSCFIIKTSKAGNEYRQYLGKDVSTDVCKKLKKEYKPRGK